jgi:adenylate kinase family enzyme
MRILVFGNAGSGKTTLARALAAAHGLAHLDLDSIVWEPGQIAVQSPADGIAASLRQFLTDHDTWAIEGCYSELVEAASPHCTELRSRIMSRFAVRPDTVANLRPQKFPPFRRLSMKAEIAGVATWSMRMRPR